MIHDINYMEFSGAALRQNADAILSYVQVPVIAMLKCSGYGVSIVEAARIWQEAGARMFGVAQPEEALALRKAGFTEDILLTSPVADASILRLLTGLSVILTVTSPACAEFYSLQANTFPVRVYVAVDTGLGRFGVHWLDIRMLEEIYAVNGLAFEGIFSHFAQSYEKGSRRTRRQLARFLQVIDTLTSLGFSVGMRHIANSCAALRFPETRLDAVRIGSAFVGRLCAPVPVPLIPVGHFKAQIVDVREFHRGDTVGYGSLCKIRRDTTAIVAAIGSENGFGLSDAPEHLRPWDLPVYLQHALRQYFCRPYVTYRGCRLPLLGRVGTQYTLFDASGRTPRPGEYISAEVPVLFPSARRRLI